MEYDFELSGIMPMLMHADDVMASDTLAAWRKDKDNKSVSVAGDDRSPAWTWMTYLYVNPVTLNLGIPQECLMTTLRNGGAKVTFKGQETFKRHTQSGIVVLADYCTFTVGGKEVSFADIQRLRDKPFAAQAEAVKKLGFSLSVRRAAVNKTKHVRVRARFDDWKVHGRISVDEPALTEAILNDVFDAAGRKSGLGDWRPSAPKSPGPYGMFEAKLTPASAAKRARASA